MCAIFPLRTNEWEPHQALKTNDIFRTMRLIRANSWLGGFEFMEPPGAGYYRDVAKRIPSLAPDQVEQLEVCTPPTRRTL